ncbi:DUF3429 domain-containing protein [Aurantiacibacter aquimixticola]|uniref:DUF3429 domain-containing protein n=1 Tax=Aurantiacibacter aquimixticola TaxID=1958945 RepID=A0A419RVY7_9SPHN|nr:DUF3429 domain-containing protein [Aurantiacibacter aquimixticola]RJY09952.1 DUF3429 domain-containing protein [Aurantiacibacter aquimixticola]
MSNLPPLAKWLGLAGLLPQLACVVAVWFGGAEWRWTGLAVGWAYAALIFTFLGGMWWGLAAGSPDEARRAPAWIWIAAITPSMIALATYLPWVFGQTWPGPSLIVLGVGILLSPLVDARMATIRPGWWMRLRVPLSLGLGLATLALAAA